MIKSRILSWAGHVARMKDRSAFKILTDRSTRMRPLGKIMCRWEDNIRKVLKEIGVNTRNWIYSG